jgi:hypothetical protein
MASLDRYVGGMILMMILKWPAENEGDVNVISDQIATSLSLAMRKRLENLKKAVLNGCSLSSHPRRKNKRQSQKAF